MKSYFKTLWSPKVLPKNKYSPPIVLRIQQEVCAHDGHTDSHNAQDDQHQHHEAIDIVDLICPERGEDEIPE